MQGAVVPPAEFFFNNWRAIARVAFIGVSGYLSLIILLRLTGARTLARLDPFDVVIVITLGSTFGRVMTAREVAYVEALTAFVVLIGMQVLFSWLRSRYPKVVRILAPAPTLLFYRGHFLRDAMMHERLAEPDLVGAIREHGFGSLEDVDAIIMESNGRLTVIAVGAVGNGSALTELSTVTEDDLPERGARPRDVIPPGGPAPGPNDRTGTRGPRRDPGPPHDDY